MPCGLIKMKDGNVPLCEQNTREACDHSRTIPNPSCPTSLTTNYHIMTIYNSATSAELHTVEIQDKGGGGGGCGVLLYENEGGARRKFSK